MQSHMNENPPPNILLSRDLYSGHMPSRWDSTQWVFAYVFNLLSIFHNSFEVSDYFFQD